MKTFLPILLFSFSSFQSLGQKDWSLPKILNYNTKEAAIVYRYGDVDNMNFGWDYGYNPFSGKETLPHYFPFKISKNDPPGTDIVMVTSGFDYKSNVDKDGYTFSTKRPANTPQTLQLRWDNKGVTIKKVVMQIFVDDFESIILKKSFQVTFNKERIPYLETVFNSLSQSGPIGKLITIDILPQYLHFFAEGKLDFLVDDPFTKTGDGFAFDFIQLLINPATEAKGIVKGKVIDYNKQLPIAGALITASNGQQTYSDKNGNFILTGITTGLAVISGVKSSFEQCNKTTDVIENDTTKVLVLQLRTREKDFSVNMQNELKNKGKLNLYGIQFDVNSDKIKPASEEALKELAKVLQQNADFKLELSGHTDADGDEKANQTLSEKRAKAVVAWLLANKVSVANIATIGYGESKPIANNNTKEGKELNRRVEIKIIN